MNTSIKIQNLKCGGCVKTITTKLSEIAQISNVIVNLESSEVSFTSEHEDNVISVEQKLLKLGYPKLDQKNSVFTKANSMIRCATGKI